LAKSRDHKAHHFVIFFGLHFIYGWFI